MTPKETQRELFTGKAKLPTAYDTWREAARTLAELLARTQEYVTSEDFDTNGLPAPSGAAAGHVFRWAARQGFLEKTTVVMPARNPHAPPLTVWASLVYEGPRTGNIMNPGTIPRGGVVWVRG